MSSLQSGNRVSLAEGAHQKRSLRKAVSFLSIPFWFPKNLFVGFRDPLVSEKSCLVSKEYVLVSEESSECPKTRHPKTYGFPLKIVMVRSARCLNSAVSIAH